MRNLHCWSDGATLGGALFCRSCGYNAGAFAGVLTFACVFVGFACALSFALIDAHAVNRCGHFFCSWLGSSWFFAAACASEKGNSGESGDGSGDDWIFHMCPICTPSSKRRYGVRHKKRAIFEGEAFFPNRGGKIAEWLM
jgi:hypothetical protein